MEIGSLVLFSADRDRTARFYRAIGIDLEREDHDDGPLHYAAELGPVHFAVYPAESAGRAPARRGGGSSFPGFFVDSLDATAASLAEVAAPVLGEHERMPWGCRMVFQDPDGRPVEINQRHHCA
jgi:lactoylglutathione lyase